MEESAMTGHRVRRDVERWALALTTFLLVSIGALLPPQAVQAAPTLTLTPNRGFCAHPPTSINVRGTDFPPGQVLEIYNFDEPTPFRPAIGVRVGVTTVGADGTFSIEVPLPNCGPGTREGYRYTIAAYRQEDRGQGIAAALATATFTVSSSPAPPPGLPNTGGGGTQARVLSPGLLVVGGLLAAAGATLLRPVRLRRRAR